MTKNIKIAVIIGSTRPNRFGDKPAKWIADEAKKLEGVEVETLDLRDHVLPFYEETAPVSDLAGKYSSEAGKRWAEKINEFDAYIIVTPEYNHGYPAVLKNALDYAYSEWHRKPVGFVSYGGVGGARSVEQLRQVVIQLQLAPISGSIQIPEFWTRINSDGSFKADGLEEKVEILLNDLMWWAKALKTAREATV